LSVAGIVAYTGVDRFAFNAVVDALALSFAVALKTERGDSVARSGVVVT
jgi:hypothetical protein